MTDSLAQHDRYKDAGVDTGEAERGLVGLIEHVRRTWPRAPGYRAVKIPIGYFANVVDFGGIGVALCTDGVGSKTIIADMMRRYDTIGIDCVAMNVNDLICVGAEPVSMVDYVAVEAADAGMLAEIGKGLAEGARQGRVSLSGGEISQLKDIVRGFDLVGMAVGRVALDRIIVGRDVRPGDAVIGLESSGIHSNGLTLARRALLEKAGFKLDHKFAELDGTLGEELLRPTLIYVAEALDLLAKVPGVKALANITSDGFLNLARVEARVGYELEGLPQPPPIFDLIRRHGEIATPEMHQVYNMGVGFCVVVAAEAADAALAVLKAHGRAAWVIGRAVDDPEKRVWIRERGLVGKGKFFAELR